MAEQGITFSRDPLALIVKAEQAFEPTEGDFLYAGTRQKTRILERTARGVDVDGNAFEPYKDNGPYYWYPTQGLKNRIASRDRFSKKVGAGEKTGIGLKFANFAAAKLAVTGEAIVNLMGFRAPHMLQAMVVKFQSGLLTIGIYGDEAKRASGHNEGTKHLPRRHFFGASPEDRILMARDLYERAKVRLGSAFR